MAFSVRLSPELDARVTAEARLRGVSKSEVVIDALERVLGLKNPFQLLDRVHSGKGTRQSAGSTATGRRFKAKLRAKPSS